MRITTKGRYAVRALIDVAALGNNKPVRLQDISERQDISRHYLEQLFMNLRTSGIVKSIRGPNGGYILAKSMNEISVKSILVAVGENINPASDINVDCFQYNDYFLGLSNIVRDYLEGTTLDDLIYKQY